MEKGEEGKEEELGEKQELEGAAGEVELVPQWGLSKWKEF
jgi:hypothetical protein